MTSPLNIYHHDLFVLSGEHSVHRHKENGHHKEESQEAGRPARLRIPTVRNKLLCQPFGLHIVATHSETKSDIVCFTLTPASHQIVERCNLEPEAERHRCGDRSQTPTGGETESRSQREEGEGAAVGDEGEPVFSQNTDTAMSHSSFHP